MINGLATQRPFHKTAAGRKQQRRLAAFASLVESEAQLDIILENDLRLKGNTTMREEVRRHILSLNPRLKEKPTGE